MHLDEVMMMGIVFYSIITFVKLMSAHFLKRKIINAGHIDKAGILEQSTEEKPRMNFDQIPALKWGLVTFFGGLGLIIIELIGDAKPSLMNYDSPMPYGIFFVFVAMGFLVYYFIMNQKLKANNP